MLPGESAAHVFGRSQVRGGSETAYTCTRFYPSRIGRGFDSHRLHQLDYCKKVFEYSGIRVFEYLDLSHDAAFTHVPRHGTPHGKCCAHTRIHKYFIREY